MNGFHQARVTGLLLTLSFLVACGGGDPEQKPTSPAPGAPDQGVSEMNLPDEGTPDQGVGEPDQDAPDAGAPDEGVLDAGEPDQGPVVTTYHQHIKPLVQAHCARCHYDGGQGVLDFTKPETARALAPVMLQAVQSGRMPPPTADPLCRDYEGSDVLSMSEASRELLAKWVAEGSQLGEEDGVTVTPQPVVRLDDADLELRLPQPYTPLYQDERNANNEYRCFALDPGRSETFYIEALHPIVDDAAIVHHVVLAKIKRQNLPAETLEMGGQDCISNMSALGDDGLVAAWAPGMDPVVFGEGAGLEVTPDDIFVLQMHYYSGSAATDGRSDRSGYAMRTTSERPKNVLIMAPFGSTSFTIPAGDDSYSKSAEIKLPVPITLWGAFPHMHILGTAYEMSIGSEEEEICALSGPRYDFDNQLTYMFREPIDIPANTPIRFSCTWNNSPTNPSLFHNPPINVGYGERTDEEMCYAFSYISIGRRRR